MRFDEAWGQLKSMLEIEKILATVASPVSLELVALRALATGDTGDLESRCADAALLSVRSSAWIGVEVYLDLLGRELSLVETQWLEPYEIVCERWRRIADTIVCTRATTSVPRNTE